MTKTKEERQEKRERLIFHSSVIVSVITLLVVFAFIGFQTYVRWKINQNFTVLGGNELEVLTISVFALIFGVVYIHRPERGEK